MSIILRFIKKEPVFVISALAALISCFFVRPSAAYVDYIDFRTLALLYSLMIVVSGMKEAGLFNFLALRLCSAAKGTRALSVILIGLCFFTSMLITNDVALITFVPFTITVLGMADRKAYMIRIIILQTVAANLGSMLTPVGNPQNLYIYSYYGFSFSDFIITVLPLWLASFALLICSCLVAKDKPIAFSESVEASGVSSEDGGVSVNKGKLILFSILFTVCLLTVMRVIAWYIMLGIIIAVLLIADRRCLIKADFILLLTFSVFFIFAGNLAKIDTISTFIKSVLSGREFICSLAASQIISNVPAALLLSGFTDSARSLLMGVNVGGLGTPIASLASLISLKLYSNTEGARTGRFLIEFIIINIIFVIILCVIQWLI